MKIEITPVKSSIRTTITNIRGIKNLARRDTSDCVASRRHRQIRYNNVQRSPILKMPVNTRLYPHNWKTITLYVKEAARWQCQCCGKKCYQPGERPKNLTRSEWTADILQVHHRNHNTKDNRLSNLLSVCAACHLNLHRGRYSPVSPGQLKLF